MPAATARATVAVPAPAGAPARAARAGDKAAVARLVERYHWLALKIARSKRVPPHFEREELVSWANIGLFDAVRKFGTSQVCVPAHNQRLLPSALFHPDRASNHTSHDRGVALMGLDITRSGGHTEIYYCTAIAESFFVTLKNELVNRTAYPTWRAAMNDIARHIESLYHPTRLHSAMGSRPANEVHDTC